MPRPDKVSQLVLQLLSQDHAMTAPEILEKLQSQGQGFNKTSVYRAIERLLDTQQLCRYLFGGTTVVYERRDHHHDHLVCNQCGRVEAVPCQIEVQTEIGGFQVDHHHVTLFGRCASCSGQTQTPAPTATPPTPTADTA